MVTRGRAGQTWLLVPLCLLFFYDCDCNPYPGCEPDRPGVAQRCVYEGHFDDAGSFAIACKEGLTCDTRTGTCVRAPGLGEPCEHGVVNCGPDLVCPQISRICTTPGGPGDDCGDAGGNPCDEGLTCTADQCMAPEPMGSTCTRATACPEDGVCNGGGAADPREGTCLAPQTEGGPCAWPPWLDDEEALPSGATGCAPGFTCQPADPPDPLAPGVDEGYVGCTAELEEAGETSCFGLPGTCVADGSLAAGEPCWANRACATARCSIADAPWGLPEIDGYACTGEGCAEFPWPGFCAADGEALEGRSCTITDLPCARGLACPPRVAARGECAPAHHGDDGAACGVIGEPFQRLDDNCVVGLECLEQTLTCRRPGPGAEGDDCAALADCGAGLGCAPDGRCAAYPTVGEPCGPELPCAGAQCNRRDARCSAVTDGYPGDCADDAGCPRGYFCWVENTRMCVTWVPAGGGCNDEGLVCEFGLVCRIGLDGRNRQCLPPEP